MDPSEFYSFAPSTPQRLHFRISKFVGSRHCFLNCPYFFLKELPLFGCFGLSDSLMYWVLMYWVLVSEKSRSQLNANLLKKTSSNFSSDALTTRPWLNDGRFFICVGHCMFNCCVGFYFRKVLRKNLFFESFRSNDKLCSVDRKYTNSGRFKLELDGPISFLFSCPEHSAMIAVRQFGFSTFFDIGHCFLNCPVTSFHFLKDLPVFPYFGLSDGLICWIMVSEKFRSQQDSNLGRKTLSDFESDALTTRPWLHDGVLTFICVGLSLLKCCVNL